MVSTLRFSVTAVMLVTAAALGGCEYAEVEPQPGGSTAPVPSAPPLETTSPEEAARQADLIEEVEALMGPPSEEPLLGVTGGMHKGAGLSTSGLLRRAGTYSVRAVCTGESRAVLKVRQDGDVVLSERVHCGAPYDAEVDLGSGQVSATLEPRGSGGTVGGGVRFEREPEDEHGDSGADGWQQESPYPK